MNHTPVKSRDLAIVGYDKDEQVLEIAFRAGGVYQYEKVDESIYQALMNASSHGTYFNQEIKNKFLSRKVR